MNYFKILNDIKNRYFRPVAAHPNGYIIHHADCNIYRSTDVYGTSPCTCGLLHDLQILPESVKLKLYPIFYYELGKQDISENIVPSKEMEMFWDALSKQCIMQEEEILIQDKKDWELINSVFGEKIL